MVRYAVVILMLAGAVALLVVEVTWRVEHSLVERDASSQSNSQVAEVRFMPEGSATPYGIGVFLRPSWAVLHSMQATLVFSGYCGEVKARWPSAQRLTISCEFLEGEPHLHQPVVSGTTAEVTVRRKLAANPAPQADAREAAHFGPSSQSRAVGRER